ncbi:ThiJ/PfpI family protein [Saitoella complicata NRRL Y-17804]|nr:ThiJ/PfpI family protein [Saitoella complicata NRRL Y-17804]ODQ50013.1 ThiJ/PfpI family protein [Saitoella complicata NRRL Y-17804]
MPTGKVLIILSDAHSFPLHKSDGTTVDQPSGFFLMELAKPLAKILDAGYEVTFASPKGQTPQPDPLSTSLLAFAGNYLEKQRETALIDKMKTENNLNTPRPFSSLSDEELATYDGVFIPGGHAPLSDLGADKELGRILTHFHETQKPTASLCHGPYALLSTKVGPQGTFVYKGYKITSWSDTEEKFMETMLGGEITKVESSLRDEGAEMVEGLAQSALGRITVDRELISAANPMGADGLGDKFVEMLKK